MYQTHNKKKKRYMHSLVGKFEVKEMEMKMIGSLQLPQLGVTLIAAIILVQCCWVEAGYRDQCFFVWGGKEGRGVFTGPDSLNMTLIQSGGAAIQSFSSFLYGKFESKIKLVSGNSSGTVTTFYLTSSGDKHVEIDYEFLGNETAQTYTIQTNLFINGVGRREHRLIVWFDPTTDYHTYTIRWTPYSVVWFVDGTPIREFKNFDDKHTNFPDSKSMNLLGSLWNGDRWATQGGRIKIDWKNGPFMAFYKELKIIAFPCDQTSQDAQVCNSKAKETNPEFERLSPMQLLQMKNIRDNFMFYDYCQDPKRFNGNMPEECNKKTDLIT